MTTKNLRVDEYLDRIDVLPPAPTLIVELLGQFKQPDQQMPIKALFFFYWFLTQDDMVNSDANLR